MSSQQTHALVVDPDKRLGNRSDNRYCPRCGAQIDGPGAWGHDDNCPVSQRAALSTDDWLRGQLRALTVLAVEHVPQCPGECDDDCVRCGSLEPALMCDDCRFYAAQD